MTLKLVPNSKQLHKSFTVILGFFLLLASIAQALQAAGLLETVRPFLSPEKFALLTSGFAVAIMVGRYIQQASILPPEDKKDTDG
jgi:hypothetical protein